MFKKVGSAVAASALLAGAALPGAPAFAQGGVRIGTLSCNVAGGWGFVFGSSKALHCVFSHAGAPPERYTGSISKFGVDIGYTQGGALIWGVFAPTANIAPGALAGNYGGATASATVASRVTMT